VVVASRIHSYRQSERDSKYLRFAEAMDTRVAPIIWAINDSRGHWGTDEIPNDFSALIEKHPIDRMPLNIYTGQPMRCIPLGAAQSPGDFTFLSANLTYPTYLSGSSKETWVTRHCGFYLIVYGRDYRFVPEYWWRRCGLAIGAHAVQVCKQWNVCRLYWSEFVEEDVRAYIQPLSEILLQAQTEAKRAIPRS
jgi:hypothetical protein